MTGEVVPFPAAEPEHAELGASAAYRWIPCPGSIRMQRGMPNVSSRAALEGTAAHELAALCLKNDQAAEEYVGRVVCDHEIDADFADAVGTYLHHCRLEMKPHVRWEVERKFSLAKFDPPAPMFGTADFVAYDPSTRKLIVKDLKFGRKRVNAKNNHQLKYYALGAALDFGEPVSAIEGWIIQPHVRAGITFDEWPAIELAEWSAELLAYARATLAPDAPLNAGPHCDFCLAAGSCAENARYSLEQAQLEFGAAADDSVSTFKPPAPESLTENQKAAILEHATEIEAWIDNVREHVKAIGGIPGRWKVVETVSNRAKFRAPAEAAEVLALTYEIDPFAPREVDSPAQIQGKLRDVFVAEAKAKGEKLTKKAAEETARGILKPHTYLPKTGTSLVPVTDDRPALAGAAGEFGALPPAESAETENTE